MKHSHYFKDVRHLDFIDIYRVIDLWEVKSAPVQHAIKKLVVAGGRGHKDYLKDLQEAIDSVTREIEMVQENQSKKII